MLFLLFFNRTDELCMDEDSGDSYESDDSQWHVRRRKKTIRYIVLCFVTKSFEKEYYSTFMTLV